MAPERPNFRKLTGTEQKMISQIKIVRERSRICRILFFIRKITNIPRLGLHGRVLGSGTVLFEDGLDAGTLGVDIWTAPSVRTTPVVNLAPHLRSHPSLGV